MGIAVGAALAAQMQRKDFISLCFFGDGALNQGILHEVSNMAAIWSLPVVFLVENNLFGMSAPCEDVVACDGGLGINLERRATAYGMPGVTCDGMDVVDVYLTVKAAVDRARSGGGPVVRRVRHLSLPGPPRRRPAELPHQGRGAALAREGPDPRSRRNRLVADGLATDAEVEQHWERRQADHRRRPGLRGGEPRSRPRRPDGGRLRMSTVATDTSAVTPECIEMTYVQALNEALREEMERDPTVFIMGEDIAVWGGGGVFGVTRGLLEVFGPERVRDTPISEAGFTGFGIGAAAAGMRPIVEYMYCDFMLVALDQILNQAAKMHYMFGGKAKVPLVLRTQEGAGRGNGPHHSQSIEAYYAHTRRPQGRAALHAGRREGTAQDRHPRRQPGHLPRAQAALRQEGRRARGRAPGAVRPGQHPARRRDVTVVGLHVQIDKALEAAEILSAEGIELEVIDPRTLVPYDRGDGGRRRSGRPGG